MKGRTPQARLSPLTPHVSVYLSDRHQVLVGASLGGAAAVDFAATYPEAVEKLVRGLEGR